MFQLEEDELTQSKYNQLQTKDQIMTPLHIALYEKNNRAVRILLQYMAKIPYNASETFKDILPDLIDFNGFIDYMEELPFQTL